jgi:fructokinase
MSDRIEDTNRHIRVATAGEALIDLVTQADGSFVSCEGGAVYNLTRAIARQGVGVAYLNALSSDRFGRGLRRHLLADGAHCAVAEAVAEPTSLAVVALDDAGKPDYAFYREGVADRVVSAGEFIATSRSMPALKMVCTGCLALAPQDRERYQPWLRASRAAGLGVVVDANLRPSAMSDLTAYRRSVREALALADVIKASDDDLALLSGNDEDPVQAARGLFADTPAAWVALTLGEGGAWLLCRDGRSWQARDTAPIKVVDTVGAGDCFLAGLLTALVTQPLDVIAAPAELSDPGAAQVLGRAVASASLCVEQRGCVPPTLDAVLQRVAMGHIPVRSV